MTSVDERSVETIKHQKDRTILVYEREPYWVPELRRQFLSETVTVRACRSLKDVDEALRSLSGASVLANLGDAPADLLRWLSRRLSLGQAVPTIVVVDVKTATLRWHAREAGALAVVDETIGGTRLTQQFEKLWRSNDRETTAPISERL